MSVQLDSPPITQQLLYQTSHAITSQFHFNEMGSEQLMLVYGHAAQITAWVALLRCRSSLRSKSLRKISIGMPSALLQVAVAQERV